MQPVTSLSDIDWPIWSPKQRATLLFIIKDSRVLLIHKKRGIGAGKINGPGGRIDDGETPAQCAVREVEEELLITATDVEEIGELRFQFVDGLSMHVFVFRTTAFTGEPTETDEATPIWVPIDDIPYEDMWADDRYWVPLMLNGTRFDGRFVFDGDNLLDHEVQTKV